MPPQASQVVPTPIAQSPAPSNADSKPWVPIPVAFSIFLGVCLIYVLSYILYRIVMSRRRESAEDIPDSPDRGVSQFMNGARLTVNLTRHKSVPLTLDESPHVPDEEKPLTDSLRPAQSEICMTGPASSSSTPIISLTSPFPILHEGEPGDAQRQQQSPTKPETISPIATPDPDQQSLTAKAKTLSKDRVDAIALDPKLAPVQGPLRPLSMVPSLTRKGRTTLFGLGFKHPRGPGGDSETNSKAR